MNENDCWLCKNSKNSIKVNDSLSTLLKSSLLMLVHLDPALDNRPKKNEKNNRLVFGNCYLSVSRYRVIVFRW